MRRHDSRSRGARKDWCIPMTVAILDTTRRKCARIRSKRSLSGIRPFLLRLAAPALLLPGCSQPAESFSDESVGDEDVGEVRELLAPSGSASVAATPNATAAPVYPPPGLTNIALNQSCSGYPSTSETDQTWGCTATCDLVDGKHSYDSWCHGHAFTGGHTDASGGPPYIEPAGPRHLVVSFEGKRQFQAATLWWHGAEHTPADAVLEYFDGAQWLPMSNVQRTYGTMEEAGSNSGSSTSDMYTFTPVTGTKFRYTFDNSGSNILGTSNIHGWLYEVEVWGRDGCAPDLPVTVSLHSAFDGVLGSQKPYRIGLEDVFPVFTTRSLATPNPDIACHLESRLNTRTMFLGPAAPWPLPGPLPAPVPIGTVAPDVDLDFYSSHPTPPRCQFGFGGTNDKCLLNDATATPRLVKWSTPGFKLNVLGIPRTLDPRIFWVDLAAIPGIAPDAALSVTVDAVEDVVEREIAANIVFAQSRWAMLAEPPLDVLVTDPAGHQSGLTSSGTSVSEIPGSTHLRMGDAGLVLVYQPPNGRYSARIMGAVGDPFSLMIATADYTESEFSPKLQEWTTSGTTDASGPTFDFTLGDGSFVVGGTSPNLELRAAPARLAPNDRLTKVHIKVAVDDKLDPSPKVVLKSVSCDDGCVPAKDIVGAALDTDDRELFLRATSHSRRRSRTYTLTYEATNKAGGVTRKDVSVVVSNHGNAPHCQDWHK
jgi:hypothetical protein